MGRIREGAARLVSPYLQCAESTGGVGTRAQFKHLAQHFKRSGRVTRYPEKAGRIATDISS
jgi:hypothetical protein